MEILCLLEYKTLKFPAHWTLLQQVKPPSSAKVMTVYICVATLDI